MIKVYEIGVFSNRQKQRIRKSVQITQEMVFLKKHMRSEYAHINSKVPRDHYG